MMVWRRCGQHLLLLVPVLLVWWLTVMDDTSCTTTGPSRPRGQLIFADEFDGRTLNTALWNTAYWWGRGDINRPELQYYAEDAFEVRDGILRIIADRRRVGPFAYTSGIITTLGKFSQRYGRFEIRAKVPKGTGLLPAGWLLLDNRLWPYEIDILEVPGQAPDRVYMTYHWKNENGTLGQDVGTYCGPTFSDQFHVFSVEWSPSSIIWLVDDVERFRSYQKVPAVPMYILINLAVGGDWVGPPDEATQFPAVLEIDYVRVYALPELAEHSPAPVDHR
jgi:beta-glucanase (GH16 family)